jgi:hypothetical protein
MTTKLDKEVTRETGITYNGRPVLHSIEPLDAAPEVGTGTDAMIRIRLKGKKSDVSFRLSTVLRALLGASTKETKDPSVMKVGQRHGEDIEALIRSLESDPVIQAALARNALVS